MCVCELVQRKDFSIYQRHGYNLTMEKPLNSSSSSLGRSRLVSYSFSVSFRSRVHSLTHTLSPFRVPFEVGSITRQKETVQNDDDERKRKQAKLAHN